VERKFRKEVGKFVCMGVAGRKMQREKEKEMDRERGWM
jgi:hypothetical protein